MRSGTIGDDETSVPIERDTCPDCGQEYTSATESRTTVTFIHHVGVSARERRICEVSKDSLDAFASLEDVAAMAEEYQERMDTDEAMLRALEQTIDATDDKV
jgi:hypothetical protein